MPPTFCMYIPLAQWNGGMNFLRFSRACFLHKRKAVYALGGNLRDPQSADKSCRIQTLLFSHEFYVVFVPCSHPHPLGGILKFAHILNRKKCDSVILSVLGDILSHKEHHQTSIFTILWDFLSSLFAQKIFITTDKNFHHFPPSFEIFHKIFFFKSKNVS